MRKAFCMIGLCLLTSACFGLKTVGSGPFLERPHYSIRVQPHLEEQVVTVKATLTNPSSIKPLELDGATFSYLLNNSVELAPTISDTACFNQSLGPNRSCDFWMKYDVTGLNPYPSRWEMVLKGEAVQFTFGK